MKKFDMYKCEECGNIVEAFNDLTNQLHCCNQPMIQIEAQHEDQSIEKHVPYISDLRSGYKVSVGKEDKHPMNEIHYIEMIELTVDNHVYKKYMQPTDDCYADFFVAKGEKVSARAYCNIHGLWTDTPIEE